MDEVYRYALRVLDEQAILSMSKPSCRDQVLLFLLLFAQPTIAPSTTTFTSATTATSATLTSVTQVDTYGVYFLPPAPDAAGAPAAVFLGFTLRMGDRGRGYYRDQAGPAGAVGPAAPPPGRSADGADGAGVGGGSGAGAPALAAGGGQKRSREAQEAATLTTTSVT